MALSLQRGPLRESLKIGALLALVATTFYPIFVMVAISLKTNEQFVRNPWFFDAPSEWQWDNWSRAWNTVSPYVSNSFFVSITATVMGMIMVILSSYALARYRFPGRNLIYYLIIATMFLPGTTAALITLFNILQYFHLMNSLWAIILVMSVAGQMAAIFIYRQFIEEIPKDLFDSAQIDGAGHFAQIRHIMLPMSGSILGVLTIMMFIQVWNELMLTLVVIRDDDLLTIPVGLMRMDGEYVKQWGELMAGYTIASLPLIILFAFTMRFFVRGLAAGAIKG